MQGQYIRNKNSFLVKKTHSYGCWGRGMKGETETEIIAAQDLALQK